jgi:predicted transglutaminase-like cysteine proteinase
MPGRIAAYAAVVFLWPICPQASDGDGPLLPPEIVVTSGPQLTRSAVSTAPPQPATATNTGDQSSAGAHAPSASPSTVASGAEPFGLKAEPVMTGNIVAKWGGVEALIQAESRVMALCRGGFWCPRAARRLLAIVNDGRARSGRARIGIINREINLSIIPTSDFSQWGVVDRWSTPFETFTTGRGDCEDYAIAKYVALRAAGMPNSDVRLIVVRNNAVGENHADVAVRLEGDWIILDNRWLALVRDREMWRATPLFELDDDGVRRFIGPAPTAKIGQARTGSF